MILDAFTYSVMTIVATLSLVIIFLMRSDEKKSNDS